MDGATPTSQTLSYGNDAAGNRTLVQTPAGNTYYQFDAAGNMSLAQPPAGIVTFIHDGERRRVGKVNTDGSYTRSVYDAMRLLQESAADGTEEVTYSTSAEDPWGDMLSEYDAGSATTLYHQFDAQASLNQLTDDAGDLLGPYQYRAFGLIANAAMSGWADLSPELWASMSVDGWAELPVEAQSNFCGFGQKGAYLDPEIRLYLMGAAGGSARHYDPITGRFISEDRIGLAGNDANLYRYCGNDPVNKVDPSGMDPSGSDPNSSKPHVVSSQYLLTCHEPKSGIAIGTTHGFGSFFASGRTSAVLRVMEDLRKKGKEQALEGRRFAAQWQAMEQQFRPGILASDPNISPIDPNAPQMRPSDGSSVPIVPDFEWNALKYQGIQDTFWRQIHGVPLTANDKQLLEKYNYYFQQDANQHRSRDEQLARNFGPNGVFWEFLNAFGGFTADTAAQGREMDAVKEMQFRADPAGYAARARGQLVEANPNLLGPPRPLPGALREAEDPSDPINRDLDWRRYETGPLAVGSSPELQRVHDRLMQMEDIGYRQIRVLEERKTSLTKEERKLLDNSAELACTGLAEAMDDAMAGKTCSVSFTEDELTPKSPRTVNAERGTDYRHFSNKEIAQNGIESLLSKNGSRGIIHIEREKGAGHYINVENICGQIWFYDVAQGVAVRTSPGALLRFQDSPKPRAAIKTDGIAFIKTN